MPTNSHDLDLSDIDPLKWAEVRRRADVVRRFVAIEKPSAADAGRFGAMLDLGSQQFNNLVKAWRAHADATALSPGERERGPSARSRSRRGGVDPRARAIAREAIAEMGAATNLSLLLSVVTARCAASGIHPPSRVTVWNLAMEAKGAKRASATGPIESVLVARATLKLPVDMGSGVGIVFPCVTVAVEVPSGKIIDLAMDLPSGEPALEFIIAAIRHSSVGVDADATIIVALAQVLPAAVSLNPVTPPEARKILANLLGRHVGRLELAYRPLVAPPERSMQSSKDRAPTRADADLALRTARDRHNADLFAGAADDH